MRHATVGVDANPDFPPLWFVQGAAFQTLLQRNEALVSFDRALTGNPDYIEVLVNSVFDTINHFFTIGQIIITGSNYWNVGIGRNVGDVEQDEEGVNTMNVLGENMAWLLKRIAVWKGFKFRF